MTVLYELLAIIKYLFNETSMEIGFYQLSECFIV